MASPLLRDTPRVFSIPAWEIQPVKDLMIERSGGDSRVDASLEDTFKMFGQAAAVLEPVASGLVDPALVPVMEGLVAPLDESVLEPIATQLVDPVVAPVVEPVATTVDGAVAPLVEPLAEPVLEPVAAGVTSVLSPAQGGLLAPVLEGVVETVTSPGELEASGPVPDLTSMTTSVVPGPAGTARRVGDEPRPALVASTRAAPTDGGSTPVAGAPGAGPSSQQSIPPLPMPRRKSRRPSLRRSTSSATTSSQRRKRAKTRPR